MTSSGGLVLAILGGTAALVILAGVGWAMWQDRRR